MSDGWLIYSLACLTAGASWLCNIGLRERKPGEPLRKVFGRAVLIALFAPVVLTALVFYWMFTRERP